jgi:hypothetical protein
VSPADPGGESTRGLLTPMDFDSIKDKLVDSKDKIGEGLDKAGEFAKDKLPAHDDKIDTGVDKAKDLLDKLDDGNKPTV